MTCQPCLQGSTPNKQSGGSFCVNCALKGKSQVSGDRFANVDWEACTMSSLECEAGKQPSKDMQACLSCEDNEFSATGDSCKVCPSGKQPNEKSTDCVACSAGTFSGKDGVTGKCLKCSKGAAFYSEGGASSCIACGPGKQPNSERTACAACPAGYQSPYGVCTRCSPGTQSSSDKAGCVGCAAVSATSFSAGGNKCVPCSGQLIPSSNRSQCEACPANLLSMDGACRPACDVLKCRNQSLESAQNTGGKYAKIESIQQLCEETSKFLEANSSRNVTTVGGLCGPGAACSIRATTGQRTVIAVRATTGSISSVCVVGVYVKAARLEVKPANLILTTLSTSSVEKMLTLSNAGDSPIVVARIVFDSESVTVSAILDSDNNAVNLPYRIAPGADLRVAVRGAGTAVPPGQFLVNGSVVGSTTGTQPFSVMLTVKPATLRVLALPSKLPAARMHAGQEGLQMMLTVYNVATKPIWWFIEGVSFQNCTDTKYSRYHFSKCKSTDKIGIGTSLPLYLKFFAPSRAGVFTFKHTVIGGSDGDFSSLDTASRWVVESTIIVSAAGIVPARSTTSLNGRNVTAGTPANLRISPADKYGNPISTVGLAFVVTVAAKTNGGSRGPSSTYKSLYDFINQVYSAEFVLSVAYIEWGIETKVGGERVGQMLSGIVPEPVECSDTTQPNDEGNFCVCRVGYARMDIGECAVCPRGSAPQKDRERGCESCLNTPGTVSPKGAKCEPCSGGEKPSSDLASCVPCPENTYFDLVQQVCFACKSGHQLNSDENGRTAKPCNPCDEYSYGTTGTCQPCDSGQQPNSERTACNPCPVGWAGEKGKCTNCAPGRAPNVLQTSCDTCLEGTYRNAEVVAECLPCPEGMVTTSGATTVAACMCPAGKYDRLDSAGYESFVWCWPEGLSSPEVPQVIVENKASVAESEATNPDGSAARRCITCGDCLDCGDRINSEVVPYWGKPFINAGWTFQPFEGDDAALAPSDSTLSTTTRPRNVFMCPFEGSCESEAGKQLISLQNCLFICTPELQWQWCILQGC